MSQIFKIEGPFPLLFEQTIPVKGGLSALYGFTFTAQTDGQVQYNFLTDTTVSPSFVVAPQRVVLLAVAGITQAAFTYAGGIITLSNDMSSRVRAGDVISGLFGDFVAAQQGINNHSLLSHLEFENSGHTGFASASHTHDLIGRFRSFEFIATEGVVDDGKTYFDVTGKYNVNFGFITALSYYGTPQSDLLGDYTLSVDGSTIIINEVLAPTARVIGTGVINE